MNHLSIRTDPLDGSEPDIKSTLQVFATRFRKRLHMIRSKLIWLIFAHVFLYSVAYGLASAHEASPQPEQIIVAAEHVMPETRPSNLAPREFPTFHPLIVHFPIALILAALPFYLLGVIRRQLVLRQSGIVLAAAGLFGGILAGYVFHPHTTGLNVEAATVLSNHDLFATLTLYVAAIAVALGALTCTKHIHNVSLQATVSALLLLSTITVSLAGHYGAMLVHLYGVGPEGHYLVIEHIDVHIPGFDR